jgi:hypothetical protein
MNMIMSLEIMKCRDYPEVFKRELASVEGLRSYVRL